MRRFPFTARAIGFTTSLLASLAVCTGAAQAAVVSAGGQTAGVVPAIANTLPGATPVTGGAGCTDPWLASDFILPAFAMCYQGGPVMHGNETFALTWDPSRDYWPTTLNYLEQFLRDVADGSGTLTSPYALTSQYQDAAGRAANKSAFGGGCIDYGAHSPFTCTFGGGAPAGNDYPTSGCPINGTSFLYSPSYGTNTVCLTDAQIQGELKTVLGQTNLLSKVNGGYQPLLVLFMPPTVATCLDSAGTVCSANSTAGAQFCSYHSAVNYNGTLVPYVVQPWTVVASSATGCDEPKLPPIPTPVDPQTLQIDAGLRIASPLSQAHIAAIVNPDLNGWFAGNGAEVSDNGCGPAGFPVDNAKVGNSSQNPYTLARDFNNGGAIAPSPNSPACWLDVNLVPRFVVPSTVNAGDVVQFDGSTTVTTVLIPNAGYAWDFGDGNTATGPSVEHSYSKGGTFTVQLTVTDRGGNTATVTQTINVNGPQGQPVTTPTGGNAAGLHAHVQLMPEGLKSVLRNGITLRVVANERADGIATVSISRADARRARIRAGRGATVVVGRGTVSGIRNGTVVLHIHIPRATAKKLARLNHVTLTIRLALVAAGANHLTIDAAGRY
jgi:PKD domain